MKTTRIVTLFFVLLFGVQEVVTARDTLLIPGVYHGFLDDIYPFKLKLDHSGAGDLEGFVYFPLSGDSLEVDVDDLGGRLILTEFDDKLTQVGYYLVEESRGIWVGNWQNQDGTTVKSVHFSKKSGKGEDEWAFASTHKWYEGYSFDRNGYSGLIFLLRQAGYSVSGVLHFEEFDQPMILRGDCNERPECESIIFSGESGDRHIFIEMHRDSLQPIMGLQPYFDQTVKLHKFQQMPATAIYSFNQHFVFDAVIPDNDELLTTALTKKVAQWQLEASVDFSKDARPDKMDVVNRLGTRNYVWTQIIYNDSDYISGFLEWIQGDSSRAISSFLLDQRKSVVYWDREIFNGGEEAAAFSKLADCLESFESGTLAVSPGGLKYISRLDKDLGRTFCFVEKAGISSEVKRNLRRFMNENRIKRVVNEQ